jgi:hypothetical protein
MTFELVVFPHRADARSSADTFPAASRRDFC